MSAPLDVGDDPLETFGRWLDAARALDPAKYDVCFVATATPDALPSVRAVLLKGFDARGLVFYTNYGSRKGAELAANANVALAMYWPQLERQVRVEGRAERASREESKAYFDSRPYESRIGAWASAQSQPIASREVLLADFERWSARYPDAGPGSVPLPEGWGGVRVVPRRIELWVAGDHRLHDRHVFERDEGGPWQRSRLSP